MQSRHEAIMRMTQRPMGKAYAAFALLTLLNFFLFVAGSFRIGGDAVNGKSVDGRYYVWGTHGSDEKAYREVSHAVFVYSKWHAYSVFATWPVMILGGIALERMGKKQILRCAKDDNSSL